jgi:hypothetical protein
MLKISLEATAGVTIFIDFSYEYIVKSVVIEFDAVADICYVVGCSGLQYHHDITLTIGSARKVCFSVESLIHIIFGC